MKNRTAAGIVLLIAGFALLRADMGRPDLQAICRVTLKDGSIVEGAVLAARGGYQRYWDASGFYIMETPSSGKPDFKIPIPFDLDFKSLEPWTGRREAADGGRGAYNFQGRNLLVFYLEDLTGREFYVNETKIAEQLDLGADGGSGSLRRTITTTYAFRLLDHVPVFTEIPDRVYLQEHDLSSLIKQAPVRVRRIPVREIAKFELLAQPSPAWLEAIAAKTTRLQAALDKCEECDYFLPVWYHDIIKNAEAYRPFVKPWATN